MSIKISGDCVNVLDGEGARRQLLGLWRLGCGSSAGLSFSYIGSQFIINLKQAQTTIRLIVHSATHESTSPPNAVGTANRETCLMNPKLTPSPVLPPPSGAPGLEPSIAQLVGQVFETAPPAERSRLLAHLLKPLSVLSLVAVANGIFAHIRLRGGWQELNIGLEDVQGVQSDDVITLVNYVQQVSIRAIDGLATMMASSPVLTGSAAAALLMTVLLQRKQAHQFDEEDGDDGIAP
jgi:hypothetical protein